MTKKVFLIFFLIFLFSLPASAQDFDFNRALSDYLYNFNLYRERYQEYMLAREAYLKYRTLTSKNTALEKTLKMAQSRDETVRTYLIALKMKLREMPGISVYDKNIFNLRLDNEIDWYSRHKEELSSAATLEDLVDLAKTASERYQSQSEILIYQTLHKILLGKETVLKEKISNQIEATREKLREIKQKGDKDVLLAERWLLEIENRLLRFEEKTSTSQENMTKMERNAYSDRGQVYREFQLTLEEAHQYLKEANRYLKEVIREVKTTDGNY
jgi:hypothetical protein